MVHRALVPVFMFCSPGLVLGGIEGVGTRFHVFRSWNLFRRNRVRRVRFSCFALPTPLGQCQGRRSRFHVLRSRTCFRRYRGRWVAFFCFALPKSLLAVARALGPVFMFCAPELIFMFYVGYRGHWVRFLCFALPDSFSTVSRTSGLIYLFCAPRLIFGGTEGAVSRFHVLRSQTRFGRYRGRRVPFSCFALPNSFSSEPTASGQVFMFCAPDLVWGCTKGAGSYFHVLRSRTCFR
jgi:hypothetical protein